MAVPTIPASNSQAVLTVQAGGTIPFAQAWYNFFAALITGPLGPVKLVGVTDGSNAAAGIVGEYIASLVNNTPGNSIADDTQTTLAQITLTAGDWDVWGEALFSVTGGTSPYLDFAEISINDTPATSEPTGGVPIDGGSGAQVYTSLTLPSHTGSRIELALTPMRVNITTSVTFYISGFVDFNASSGSPTCTYGCAIRARRMR